MRWREAGAEALSWAEPDQKEKDELAKTSKKQASWRCVCGAITPKWLSVSRCSYCKPQPSDHEALLAHPTSGAHGGPLSTDPGDGPPG
jgi:hypothetical protein